MLNEIKKILEEYKFEIIEVLKEIETEEVALEEFSLSINALNNNTKYCGSVDMITAYLPMNLPLYSLITYVVVPKLSAQKINYRPSGKVLCQLKKIHNILMLEKYHINLFEGTRYDYFNKFVSKSDVVIFVGKPENAEKLISELPKKTMFIYFGIGQNPAVLVNNADLNIASEKIAKTIMFNYGQDCAKPNVILCRKSIYEDFVKKLILEIEKNICQKTSIKNSNTFIDITKLLVKDIENIKYGGEIDFKNKTLNPIIITKELTEDNSNYDEFYAPIFRIMLYDNISDLKQYFSNNIYKQENMNITLFGDSEFISKLPSSLVLHNEMVPEIDNGYCEYGGYGEKTSFLQYNGIKIVKPILINREIEYFFNNPNICMQSRKNEKSVLSKNRLSTVLYEEYKQFVNKLFSDDLKFGFIFGSYAKGTQKMLSDIDIFVCLNKIDEDKEKKFREWYFKFHYMYGKIPDFYYPGEIITENKLNDIVANNKYMVLKAKNDLQTFDALFYTQILTDKKREIIGNHELLLKYEYELRKYIPDFCNQIYEVLVKNNMIKDERDNMKCLMALANNDLLFFGKKIEFEEPKDKYADIVEGLDDGFLVKCLKKYKKI